MIPPRSDKRGTPRRRQQAMMSPEPGPTSMPKRARNCVLAWSEVPLDDPKFPPDSPLNWETLPWRSDVRTDAGLPKSEQGAGFHKSAFSGSLSLSSSRAAADPATGACTGAHQQEFWHQARECRRPNSTRQRSIYLNDGSPAGPANVTPSAE